MKPDNGVTLAFRPTHAIETTFGQPLFSMCCLKRVGPANRRDGESLPRGMGLPEGSCQLAGPNPRYASQHLMAAGHSEDEIRGAWGFARAAGYSESSGLGTDRLTAAGKVRAAVIRSDL